MYAISGEDEVSDMALVAANSSDISSFASPLLITAILEHYCSLHAGLDKNNPQLKEKLFQGKLLLSV